MRASAYTRFLRAYVVAPSGCWEWQKSKDRKGYGQIMAGGSLRRAHRFAYETFVGSIPEGLTLDHLCRNPSCVNPAHLEPVTARENILRGDGVAARRARQTHCKHGHEFTAENTRVTPSGSRRCRTCATRTNKAASLERSRLRAEVRRHSGRAIDPRTARALGGAA